VVPVRTGGGMRMKVLQAMAYGKPVVTTARGAEGLRVNELPLPLVTAEDTEGIAAATAQLLADPVRRRTLGQAARAYVAEHFSPEAYALRQEAIYAELRPAGEAGQSGGRPMTAATAGPATNRVA
jgi:polysaccharide biosynthesis protein PslH